MRRAVTEGEVPVQATPADAVADSRHRLLRGLATAIKERGYRDTTIADIVANARTSRRTFYAVFKTKDECFVSLLFELGQRMRDTIETAVNPDSAPPDQIRAGVMAWITLMASEPEISVSWIRELPSLGPTGAAMQRAAIRSLTQLLVGLSDTQQLRDSGLQPISSVRATILIGGLRELVATACESGDDILLLAEPAVDAALSLLAIRPSAQPVAAAN